jgi:hypothetical protein
MAKYVLGMAVAGAAALAGCMLGPTDGERVANTTDPLPFFGYDLQAPEGSDPRHGNSDG